MSFNKDLWHIKLGTSSSAGLEVSRSFTIPDLHPLYAREGFESLRQTILQTFLAPWAGSLSEKEVLWIREEVDHLGIFFLRDHQFREKCSKFEKFEVYGA